MPRGSRDPPEHFYSRDVSPLDVPRIRPVPGHYLGPRMNDDCVRYGQHDDGQERQQEQALVRIFHQRSLALLFLGRPIDPNTTRFDASLPTSTTGKLA
jgi:hypothetical protein